ncbi:MAG: hypothetical protein P8R54_34005 [Myxococcota bacterium]|nr:hypothetical protein [Myxococcota bacterium]
MIPLFLTLSLSHAGTKADLKAGAAAYQRQDYGQAISALRAAVGAPVRLKEDRLVEAHRLLARALLAALSQTATSGDAVSLIALQDAPIEAATSLLWVRDHDPDWGAQESAELEMVKGMLMQGVIGALSAGDPATLAAFEDWADMSAEIGGYLSLDLRGQLRHGLGRGDDAYADYAAAIDAFRARTDARPDFLIAYTAYRAAAYAVTEQDDRSAALGHLDAGLALLEGEWSRIDEPTAEQHRRHESARADLGSFRLSILQQSPDLFLVALAALAAAVEQDLDSYPKTLAYAQLLELEDPVAAVAVYTRAIALEPGESLAHFSLGALHINRAVTLIKAANEEADPTIASSLSAEGDASFLLARPHLAQALVLEPTNREAIRALKQIALRTDDIEAYRQLQAAEAALGLPQ